MSSLGWIALIVMFYGLGWLAGATHIQRKWNEDLAEEIRQMGGDPKYP